MFDLVDLATKMRLFHPGSELDLTHLFSHCEPDTLTPPVRTGLVHHTGEADQRRGLNLS